VTPEGIAADEAIMKENRRVTANEIAAQWRLHRKNEVIAHFLCSINYKIKSI